MVVSSLSYSVGDTVEYRPSTGPSRVVKVTSKSANIKNGRPGFDGVNLSREHAKLDANVWGYDDQIVRVLNTA